MQLQSLSTPIDMVVGEFSRLRVRSPFRVILDAIAITINSVLAIYNICDI